MKDKECVLTGHAGSYLISTTFPRALHPPCLHRTTQACHSTLTYWCTRHSAALTNPQPLAMRESSLVVLQGTWGFFSDTFIRQHTSSYVSIRQHTSAYVSIRQHASALKTHYLQHSSETPSSRVRAANCTQLSLLVRCRSTASILLSYYVLYDRFTIVLCIVRSFHFSLTIIAGEVRADFGSIPSYFIQRSECCR